MTRVKSYETKPKNLKVLITDEEMATAKAKAKSEGMTFQCWLAKVINDATKKEASDGKAC